MEKHQKQSFSKELEQFHCSILLDEVKDGEIGAFPPSLGRRNPPIRS